MDHKKRNLIIILALIIIVILIFICRVYVFYPKITSFRPLPEKLEQDYAVSFNTEESFTASSRLFFHDFIILSEEGEQIDITFIPNNNRVYSYEIIDGELLFVRVVDENDELICSRECEGIYRLDQILVRTEITQQLYKYY